MHHFIAIGQFKLELQSGSSKFGLKPVIFFSCDLEIWQMTLKNNMAPFLCYLKLCASFHSHRTIKTGVAIQKPLFGSNHQIFVPCDLKIWQITLKKNRAPLLCHIKLCASFHCHMWIQTGVTVQKQLNWVLTSMTWTFDLWPWPFTWTLLLSIFFLTSVNGNNSWKFHDDMMGT